MPEAGFRANHCGSKQPDRLHGRTRRWGIGYRFPAATATVRELRNRYAQLLKWLEAGEEITITRRGVPIARLVPERPQTKQMLDWTDSAAFGLEQLKLRPLTARESADLLDYNRGPD